MAVSTAVPPSAQARALGIETIFQNRRAGSFTSLPQRVAMVGQGLSTATYSTTKAVHTSSLSVGQTYGFGSPLHLSARQLLPDNNDGIGSITMTVYPLVDDASGVPSTGGIIPSGSQTEAASYVVRVSNIVSLPFVIGIGDTVSEVTAAITLAVNGSLNMPVSATDNGTDVDLVSKWEGESANNLFIEIVGTTTAGYSFSLTQPTGGLVDPDVQSALDQVGDVWESMFLNCLATTNTTALTAFSTFGEGRWGALTRKPCVVLTGTNTATAVDAIVIPEGRKTDRTNGQLIAPASNDPLFVIAARQLARIVTVANSDPARDYGGQPADGLTPGPDGAQWLYNDRDLAVKGGSSTSVEKNGVVTIGDVVTFYHPDGDPLPAYRWVKDIVRLQNVLYAFNLEFDTIKWDGAPLIPDDQATTSSSAKKPKDYVAAAAAIVDNLALAAILSEPEVTKAGIVAEIDSGNPNRVNMCVPVTLSGNSNIVSMDLKFGFFSGATTTVA